MPRTNEISPRAAAQKLGVSMYFVYQLLWTGKLRGKKVGKNWLIPVDAVEARLKQRG